MDVALVGRERPGDENLSLRYLAAALARTGHRPNVVPLSGPPTLARVADDVLRMRPGLVGVSIPDPDIALDALALVRLLRRRGYAGHVTCGGVLATIARREILARQPGIDSVVRHTGERQLVELAARLAAGRAWEDVPGLSTRRGDGAPAPVANPTPLRTRPLRTTPLPRMLGVPTARILGSRGCPGRCAYCGPAALQEEAVREGLAAGLTREELARCGVGGIRRRAADDLAEEVAALYHDRGARFFIFVDDNVVAGDGPETLAWIRDLRHGLARRRVGRTAWSLQVEARRVTDELADELAALGMIRALVGVESLTPAGLQRLGRAGDPATTRRALDRMRRAGAVVDFNLIAVHPGTDPAGLGAEIDALASLSGVHYDLLAMAVYPGTQAWRQLREAGELSGGVLSWRHEIPEPAVARFRSLLVRLRRHGMGAYGANLLCHDVCVNAVLARHLGLDPHSATRAAALDALLGELNARRVATLREALALAEADLAPGDRAAAERRLVLGFHSRMRAFRTRLERLQAALERDTGTTGTPRNLFFRSAFAAAFLLCGGAAAGCWDSTSGPRPDVEDVEGDAGRDDGAADDAVRRDDGSPPDVGRRDEATDEAGAADDAGDDAGCTGEGDFVRLHERIATAGCPCDADSTWTYYGLVIDAEGRVTDVLADDGSVVPDEVRTCYLEALAGETFPCLGPDDFWYVCPPVLF